MSKKIKSFFLFRNDYAIESVHSDDVRLKGYKYSFIEYDEKGNVIEEIKYDPKGFVQEHYKKLLNNEGLLMEFISYDDIGEVLEHEIFERDKEKIIKSFKHYMDGSQDTVNYEYDKDGNLINKTVIDEDGEQESKMLFEYTNGKISREEAYDDQDHLITSKAYIYDELGNVAGYIYQDDEAGEKYKIIDEVDEKGNVIRKQRYDGDDKLTEQISYKYNNQGNVVQMISETVEGKNIANIKYDEQGNVVYQEELNPDGEVNHKVSRKFDEEGNVIETEAYINLHGMGMDQHYILKYEYTFFD